MDNSNVSRSSQSIVDSYRLYEDMSISSGGVLKEKQKHIATLFLVKTSDGLRFVDKKSFRGKLFVIRHTIVTLFGRKGCLDFSSNIQLFIETVKMAKDAPEATLKKKAEEITASRESHRLSPLTEKDLRQIIVKLGNYADDLKAVVKRRRTYEKSSFFQRLKNFFSRLWFAKDYIPSLTRARALGETEKPVSKSTKISKDSDIKKVNQNTGYIQTLSSRKDPVINVSLKEFANVFGDPFIAHTGLEGHYEQRFLDIVVSFLKDKNPQTPSLKKLLSSCEGKIDLRSSTLTPNSLCEHIKQQVGKNGRSLLTGGWIGHAICYEIERQNNGKYTFRVFNEGDGIQYHMQYTPQYRKKSAPCIAVKDIDEKNIFNPSFLGCVQSLTSLEKVGAGDEAISAAELLATHLLPMLGGVAEALPPHVQSMVSPQRSGTCTYKSFEAFVARSLSKEEYKQFKFDFKLFLLYQYRSSLQLTAKRKVSSETYDSAREEYAAIKRSIEQFALSVERRASVLGEEDLKGIRALVDEYLNLLAEYESRIVDFDKTIYTKTVENITTSLPLIALCVFPFGGNDVSKRESNFPKSFVAALEAIEKISDSSHPEFSKEVEVAFYAVGSCSDTQGISKDEFFYLYNELFHKINHLNVLDTLKFENPSGTFNDLNKITKKISTMIDAQSCTELYCLFLCASHGLEVAYSQCGEDNLLEPHSPSVINSSLLPNLKSLQCSDPFWVAIIRELTECAKKNRIRYFEGFAFGEEQKLIKKSQCLSEVIAKAVWNWYNRPNNEILRKRVEESILTDRAKQERKIKDDEERIGESLAADRNLLKTLPKNSQKADDVKSRIYKKQNELKGVRDAVEKSDRYWPKGFEYSEAQGGAGDLSYKAPFLFAEGGDVLSHFGYFVPYATTLKGTIPQKFREFCTTAVLVENIFKKKTCDTSDISAEFDIDSCYWNKSPLRLALKPNVNFSQGFYRNTDRYVSRMQSSPGLQALYQSFWKKKPSCEPNVPHFISTAVSGEKDLDADEAVEIASVYCNPQMQVHSVISFFQENFSKLNQASWLNLFHSFVFESDLLLSELKDDVKREHLIAHFRTFFNQSVREAIKIENYASASNLLWLASNVERYVDYISKERVKKGLLPIEVMPPFVDADLKNSLFEAVLKKEFSAQLPVVLEAFLASSIKTFEKWPAMGNESMSSSRGGLKSFLGLLGKGEGTLSVLNKSDEVQQKQLAYASLALCLLEDNIIAKDDEKCDPRRMDVSQARFMFNRLMIKENRTGELLKMLRLHGAQLLHLMYPDFSQLTLQTGNFLGEISLQSEGKVMGHLCPGQGCVISEGGRGLQNFNKTLTDEEIHFLKNLEIFPSDQDYSSIKCCRDGKDVFVKNRERNVLLRFNVMEENRVLMKENSSNTWMRFIPISERVLSLDNAALIQGYHFLQGKNFLFLYDKDSLSPVYVSNMPESGGMKLFSVGKDKIIVKAPKDLFSTFEDPRCTVCLADAASGAIQEIRFPRLDMTLQKQDNMWVFAEQREWHVANEQFVPHFGQSTGFLVLENSKGERKVVFPEWNPQTEEKKALNFTYSYQFAPESLRKGRYVECDITKKNILVPKTYEARICLARIYIEKGFLEDAENLLFAHEALVTNRKLTEEEESLLKSIYSVEIEGDEASNTSGDIGARTIRLRTRALYLLKRNQKLFPIKKETSLPLVKTNEAAAQAQALESEKKKQSQLVSLYLSRVHSIEPLEKGDELFLLKALEKEGAGTREITKRISELKGEMVPGTDIREVIPEVVCKKLPWNLSYGLGEKIEGKMKSYVHKNMDKLPFDPTTVTGRELDTYLPYIETEVEKLVEDKKGWRSNKLVPALYYMSLFSKDYIVKQMADYFMSDKLSFIIDIQENQVSDLLGKQGARTPRKTEGKTLPFTGAKRDLVALHCIEASFEEKEFLEQKNREYFQILPQKEKIQEQALVLDGSCPEICDQTVRKKFENAAKDMEVAAKRKPEEEFFLSENKDIEDLKKELQVQYNIESEKLERQEVAITQSVAMAVTADPVSKMQFTSKKRTLPAMNELCIMCAKKNAEDYIETMYPELSREAIKVLRDSVRQYLIQKRFCQRLEKGFKLACSGQSGSAEEISSLESELARALKAKRVYAENDPYFYVYILIETVLNITLRPDQVSNLGIFLKAKEEGKEVVLQMIMGAGKTAVLQPILGFLFAEPGVLSVVDVPEANFPTVRNNLATSLGGSFNQYVYTMEYERTTVKEDSQYLDYFYKTLKEIKDRGGCLLRTPRMKHSMITSLYEAYYDCCQDPPPAGALNRLMKITKICELAEVNERVQIDEIHSTMNSKVVFKYPVGDGTSVNGERAEILSELLIDTAMDDSIVSSTSIDFMEAFQKRLKGDLYQKKGNSLTEEGFVNEFQEKLANKAVGILGKKIPAIKDKHLLLDFLQQKTPFDKVICAQISAEKEAILTREIQLTCPTAQSLEQYQGDEIHRLIVKKLLHKKKCVDWIEKTVPDGQQKELIGVLAAAISNILSSSLFKECGAHYGEDPEEGKYVARPYAAPKCPKKTIHSDPYEQVIYTTQQTLYYGIPKEAALTMLQRMQVKIRESLDRNIPLEDISEHKRLERLLGKGPLPFRLLEVPVSEAYLEAFMKSVNKDKESILEFLRTFAVPQIKVFSKNLSSTPQTLAGSSWRAYGYTGTLHEGILSRGMVAMSEQGTDGRTILAVEEKMAKGVSKTTVIEEKDGLFIDQALHQLAERKDLFVFLDSGGWLKEENIREYGERVLRACQKSRPEIKGIVYHKEVGKKDEIGTAVSLQFNERGVLEEVPLVDSEYKTTDGSLLTIITQRYETGTNILQKDSAKAIVSIRKDMKESDLLQSVFRMRKILGDQAASFLVARDVRNDIVTKIWNGLLKNESFVHAFDSCKSREECVQAIQALKIPPNIRQQLILACQKTANFTTKEAFIDNLEKIFLGTFVLDSTSVWRYVTANEAIEEQEQNWMAAKQRMREVVEKPIRMVLENSVIDLESRLTFFKEMESLFMQHVGDSPYSKMIAEGHLESAEVAIAKEVDHYLSFVHKLQKMRGNPAARTALEYYCLLYKAAKNKEDLIMKDILTSCVKKEDIASVVQSPESTVGQELEVEVEIQTEEEKEEEAEVTYDNLQQRKLISLFTLDADGVIGTPPLLETVDKLEVKCKAEEKLSFPLSEIKPIEYSPNLILKPHRPDTNYHLPGRYLLAIRDKLTGSTRHILLGVDDAAMLKKHDCKASSQVEFVLMNLSGDEISSSSKEAYSHLNQNDLMLARIQGKLCTGKAYFSRGELDALEKMLQEKPEAAKNLQYFYETILRHLPTVSKQYSKTRLHRILSPAAPEGL